MESSPFKTKTVVQVQDSCIELKRNVLSLRDEFRKRLEDSYDNVVETNDCVRNLYDFAKKVDSELLDLCFGEDEYLPRINDMDISLDTVIKGRKHHKVGHLSKDIKDTLRLSEWIVSIAQFKQNPLSEENFDRLMETFSNLEITELVIRYCNDLGEWLLNETPQLKVDNLLSLLNVVNREELEFDSEVRNWLFTRILSHPAVFSDNITSELEVFISTLEFRSAMSEKLCKQCAAEFKRWQDRDRTNVIPIDPYDTEKAVGTLVDDINTFEMGITDSERLLFFEIRSKIERLLIKLAKFDHNGIYVSNVEALEQFIENERERIPRLSEQAASPAITVYDKASSMDALLNNLLSAHNDTKYLSYLAT